MASIKRLQLLSIIRFNSITLFDPSPLRKPTILSAIIENQFTVPDVTTKLTKISRLVSAHSHVLHNTMNMYV